MQHNKKAHQGEILERLVKKSGLKKGEVSKNLNIHPSHLARVFSSEVISSKIKREAAAFFGVDLAMFEEGPAYEMPPEAADRVGDDGEEYKSLAAEVERLKAENAKMAEDLLRERGLTDDLRAALRVIAGNKAKK